MYFENVLGIVEEGPDIKFRSTYECILVLLDVSFLHHHDILLLKRISGLLIVWYQTSKRTLPVAGKRTDDGAG
jgi:hypothetical protein